MSLRALGSASEESTVTATEGKVSTITLPPGRYELTTTKPLEVDGRSYGWDLELPLTQTVNEVELSQSNAVVLNETPSPTGTTGGGGQVTEFVPDAHGAATADEATQAQIKTLLQEWTSSLKAKNLDRQMACYAPLLSIYFRKRNVPRSEVRRDKEHFFQRYPQIRRVEISNLRITGSEQPEAVFVKTWDFGGGEHDWNGQVLSHLTFTKENGRWVISAERERLVQVTLPFSESEP